jgi:hypothetical protein
MADAAPTNDAVSAPAVNEPTEAEARVAQLSAEFDPLAAAPAGGAPAATPAEATPAAKLHLADLYSHTPASAASAPSGLGPLKREEQAESLDDMLNDLAGGK